MKKVSVVNHKGGVGKTTTALNLASELGKRGYKVLLVDFDMQGNLTTACGLLEKDSLHKTISDGLNSILKDEYDEHNFNPSDYEYDTKLSENVKIIPCNISMANTILTLNNSVARERYLKEFLANYEDKYDFCIIDSAPSILIDLQNVLVAADYILMVSSPNTFSNEGIESLVREIVKIKRYFNNNLNILGILINNIDTRTRLHKDMEEAIRNVWKDMRVFKTKIPQSIRVQESQVLSLSVGQYEKKNPASIAFSNFADEFIETIKTL